MSGIGGSVEQMTQGHLRNVQQLAVFYTGHNNIFVIDDDIKLHSKLA